MIYRHFYIIYRYFRTRVLYK